MSHRRGRVQIMSPEDELDNLQQLSDIQPAATTTPSSFDPSNSSDPSVVGSSSSKKRTRGPTRNLDLLSMKPKEKKTTRFNTKGQVVYDGKGERLSSYMGTLVRSQQNVPIQVQDWNHVSEDVKEKIWALVLEKYELEETCKSYILQCCGNLFRSYRNKMKAKYYNPYNTDEERLCQRPPHLSDDDWRWLIHFWGTPEAKDISDKNKANRAKQVIKHTSRSKSYAQIRYEQVQKKEDRNEPNRIEMFALTHTRKDGTPVDDHSKEIMDQVQQLLSQPEGTSSSTSASSGASTSISSTSVALTYVDEIYTQVMGPKRHGRVRGYGFGPTPTSIFGSTSRKRSGVILSTQIKNAQEMLIATEQKFTTATEEISNVKEKLSHVKETFEERLIEFQRKTREEVKEEFEEKMMEMQRKMQAQMQAQIQEQMMQMMQQFQQKQ
ncbi:uncharacterized protein LOC109124170 [Vitis vinifera]|uniref:uncharacterized protein LOC109124170 n=1 Tax=Vitis vinifera TaxID=29760 RepID=UPI002882E179|nr:uncharacterized protein LOC109124170 [Vitis vinifera]